MQSVNNIMKKIEELSPQKEEETGLPESIIVAK